MGAVAFPLLACFDVMSLPFLPCPLIHSIPNSSIHPFTAPKQNFGSFMFALHTSLALPTNLQRIVRKIHIQAKSLNNNTKFLERLPAGVA